MNTKFIQTIIIVTLFISPAIFNISHSVNAEQNREFVILFDEYHGQFFNRTHMNTALQAINESMNVRILFQTDSPFNETNLQGIDLIIITNPGSFDKYNLTITETNSILEYMRLGGSLFVLSNPLMQDKDMTGKPHTLNNGLLNAGNNYLGSMRFREKNFNSSVLVDDFNNFLGNETYIKIDEYEFNHTIFKQKEEVSDLLIYSSSIATGNENELNAIGRTPSTTYDLDSDGAFLYPTNDFLTWFFAKELNKKSRFALSGSTIMFSDIEIKDSSTWISQRDNLKLWKNTIDWLLGITPQKERLIIVIPTFGYLSIAVIGFSLSVFGISILVYIIKDKNRKKTISVK